MVPGCACSAGDYLVQLEVVHLLLVLCSTQLFTQSAAAQLGAHPFLDAIMQVGRTASHQRLQAGRQAPGTVHQAPSCSTQWLSGVRQPVHAGLLLPQALLRRHT